MRFSRLALLLPVLLLAAAPAQAAERKLTLYSNPIDVQPYTGEQHYMELPANGEQAPAEPGWITSIKVDIVKKKSPTAKALSIQDVMIHHIVLHAPNAVWSDFAGNCAANLFAMGEENQEWTKVGNYGIRNATPRGKAPNWRLTHMLMNHRPRPFTAYVRTKITYSDTPKTEVIPLWMDTFGCHPDPTYTVPGGGKKGSEHVDRHTYRVPQDGRIIGMQGHLHGGGKYQTLRNTSCGGELLARSQAYYGMRDHIFYKVRPILHEPSPISMSRTISEQGLPVSQGDKLELKAVYDNVLPHTRVMSIMMGLLVPGEVDGCEALPDDLKTEDVPRKFRKPYPPATVPLSFPPTGPFKPFSGQLDVVDYAFEQRRVVVDRGTEVVWKFNASDQHDVSVANGPRAFSSDWISKGEFSYTPRVKGTYELLCSLHPGLMSQQLKVR